MTVSPNKRSQSLIRESSVGLVLRGRYGLNPKRTNCCRHHQGPSGLKPARMSRPSGANTRTASARSCCGAEEKSRLCGKMTRSKVSFAKGSASGSAVTRCQSSRSGSSFSTGKSERSSQCSLMPLARSVSSNGSPICRARSPKTCSTIPSKRRDSHCRAICPGGERKKESVSLVCMSRE